LHELPIAQGVLESVLRHAAASNASRVTAIYLVIGDLSGVSSECLEFYWDSLSHGTPAQGAAIHVRRVPLEMVCLDCAHAFVPVDVANGYDCPACGMARVRMSHGQECCLEAIDVDQADVPCPDGAASGRSPAIDPRMSS
jgi:hydrogenase nickel incorporation protein HypA/HybF